MKLWHQSRGEGRTVLLLHAGICDSRMWERQMGSLTGAGRIVSCDMRGFGRTPAATEPYADAADVIELIEAEGLAPVVLVGSSMGGAVAFDLTIARPDLVAGLVLAAATHPSQEWSAHMEDYEAREEKFWNARDVEGMVELNMRIWIDGPSRQPDEVDPEMRGFVAEMLRNAVNLQLAVPEIEHDDLVEEPGPRLGEIAVPTLVTAGDLDIPEMLESAYLLGGDIPGARVEIIAGASHLPSLEQPDEFEALLLDYLADLED